MKAKSEDGYIHFPEEYPRRRLTELYRAIPLEDETVKLLRRYFRAMANLYGVIPLSKAYEIVREQNPDLISEREFLRFAEVARHETEDHYILGADELYLNAPETAPMDREIIQAALFDSDGNLYGEIVQIQQDKPYYIPEKKALLRYQNVFYCEPTPQTRAMRAFLRQVCGDKPETAEALFEALVFLIRDVHSGVGQELDMLKAYDISLNKAQTERFITLYNDLHNNTKMPCNRGYSPNELAMRRSPEERAPRSISFGPNIRKYLQDGTMDIQELSRHIMEMELPSEELRFSMLRELAEIAASVQPAPPRKIGRNDPCPCGSGKKYKNCCGR